MKSDALPIHLGGAATAIAVTIAAAVMIVQPLRRSMAEEARLETELSELEEQAASHRLDLEQRLGRLRTELAAAEVELLPVHQLNRRLADMTALLEQSGMTIQETELGETRGGRWFRTVPIRLAGTGSFPQCAAFLHELRSEMPDTGVIAFDLSGSPDRPGQPTSFRFDLVWFAAPAGGADAADAE